MPATALLRAGPLRRAWLWSSPQEGRDRPAIIAELSGAEIRAIDRGIAAMQQDADFTDHYEILRVDWRCDAKALEAAYRSLAKIYHPDHQETADVVKFNRVIDAYRKLRDPALRAEYDKQYKANRPWAGGAHMASAGIDIDTQEALDDADAQSRILRELYKRRRQNAQDAGIAPFFLQEMLGCSDEHFDFHQWYLKSKGLIEMNERGTLAITIEGVDHVIATSRTSAAEQLLIAQARERNGEPQP